MGFSFFIKTGVTSFLSVLIVVCLALSWRYGLASHAYYTATLRQMTLTHKPLQRFAYTCVECEQMKHGHGHTCASCEPTLPPLPLEKLIAEAERQTLYWMRSVVGEQLGGVVDSQHPLLEWWLQLAFVNRPLFEGLHVIWSLLLVCWWSSRFSPWFIGRITSPAFKMLVEDTEAPIKVYTYPSINLPSIHNYTAQQVDDHLRSRGQTQREQTERYHTT